MANSQADRPKESERAFGARVRELRSAHGLSQVQLAERLVPHGVALHQSAVAKIESGSRPTSVPEVVALATVFAVPVAELFAGQEPDGSAIRLIEASTETVRAAQHLVDLVRAVPSAEQALRGSVERLGSLDASIQRDSTFSELLELEHVLSGVRRAKAQAAAALAEIATLAGDN